MQCPRCGDEYEPGVRSCRACGIDLAAPGARAPLQTSHLGHFHSLVGDRVLQTLRAKGIDYDFDRSDGHDDDTSLVIRVDAARRDEVAAALYGGWSELLAGLTRDAETPLAFLASGGSHPGWLDAPGEAWADRDGRLRMEIGADGDPDGARVLGPTLMVIGLALLLLGLVDAIGIGLGATFGISLLAVGALLPR